MKAYIELQGPRNAIIDRIAGFVKSGNREIWLGGRNLSIYGVETHGKPVLPRLLEQIASINGDFMVMVGSLNPRYITQQVLSDLIRAYNNRKIYKFLHLQLHSGDNDILARMKCGYDAEDFIDISRSFRDAYRTSIETDVVLGFPGETDLQFRKTMQVINFVKPDSVNISTFNSSPSSILSELREITRDVLAERIRKLTNLCDNISYERNRECLDWKGEIIVTEEGEKPGQWVGRNFAYKPVVINRSGNMLGKRIKIKVVDASPHILSGFPVRD